MDCNQITTLYISYFREETSFITPQTGTIPISPVLFSGVTEEPIRAVCFLDINLLKYLSVWKLVKRNIWQKAARYHVLELIKTSLRNCSFFGLLSMFTETILDLRILDCVNKHMTNENVLCRLCVYYCYVSSPFYERWNISSFFLKQLEIFSQLHMKSSEFIKKHTDQCILMKKKT